MKTTKFLSGTTLSFLMLSTVNMSCIRGVKPDSQMSQPTADETASVPYPEIKNKDGSTVPLDYTKPITCAASFEAVSFSFAANEELNYWSLKAEDLGLRGGGDPMMNIGLIKKPSDRNNIRVDYCISFNESGEIGESRVLRVVVATEEQGMRGTLKLKKVYAIESAAQDVKKTSPGVGLSFTVIPTNALAIKNNEKALQSGDYTDFSLKISTDNEILSIQETKFRGKSALIAWDSKKSDEKKVSSFVLLGLSQLENKDVYAIDSVCGAGWIYKKEEFKLSSANMSFDTCERCTTGMGNTCEFKRIKLNLTDDSEGLQGKKINLALDEAALQSALKIETVHHNFTDEFILTLPEVSYRVKTERKFLHCFDLGGTAVSFEVTYKGKAMAPGEGVMKCLAP